MKTTLITLLSSSLLFGSQSLACAGFPAGVQRDSLLTTIAKVESKLSQEQSLGSFSKLQFYWADINASRGIEGDCSAITLSANVNIGAESAKGETCALPARVEFVDTDVDFAQVFEAQIGEPNCF